jgi:hypothetical protein
MSNDSSFSLSQYTAHNNKNNWERNARRECRLVATSQSLLVEIGCCRGPRAGGGADPGGGVLLQLGNVVDDLLPVVHVLYSVVHVLVRCDGGCYRGSGVCYRGAAGGPRTAPANSTAAERGAGEADGVSGTLAWWRREEETLAWGGRWSSYGPSELPKVPFPSDLSKNEGK